MSVLSRFKIGDKPFKALIFEQSGQSGVCVGCGSRKFGLLVRFSDPVKGDRLICHECIVKLAYGEVSLHKPNSHEVQILLAENEQLKEQVKKDAALLARAKAALVKKAKKSTSKKTKRRASSLSENKIGDTNDQKTTSHK